MNKEDLPFALSVHDVAKIMGIGLAKAYEMAKRPDFPALRDGRRIIISRDRFFRWFSGEPR